MTFAQFDLLARGGSITLLLLWSWVLWRDHRGLLAGRPGVAMNACVISYLVVTMSWGPAWRPIGFVFELGAGATPGLFWLFARAWFADEPRTGRWPVLLVLLSVVNNAVIRLTFESQSPVFWTALTLMRAGSFVFAAAGLWEAWRGRDGDLVEARRRLRLAVIVTVGGYVVLVSLSEIAVYQGGAPHWIVSAVGSSIVIVTLGLVATMLGSRQPDLLGPPTLSHDAPAPPDADDPLVRRLRDHMAANFAWRDETLTIASLAGQLGLQEYQLRRLINGTLGHRNFAAFLNGYRLGEVKAALADAAQRDVPILTIALDAGFGSLGPFNRAFREAEGMTPSEFRASHG